MSGVSASLSSSFPSPPFPPLTLSEKIDDLVGFSSLRNFRRREFKPARAFIATLKDEAIFVPSFLAGINVRDEKFANFPWRPSFLRERGYSSRVAESFRPRVCERRSSANASARSNVIENPFVCHESVPNYVSRSNKNESREPFNFFARKLYELVSICSFPTRWRLSTIGSEGRATSPDQKTY